MGAPAVAGLSSQLWGRLWLTCFSSSRANLRSGAASFPVPSRSLTFARGLFRSIARQVLLDIVMVEQPFVDWQLETQPFDSRTQRAGSSAFFGILEAVGIRA